MKNSAMWLTLWFAGVLMLALVTFIGLGIAGSAGLIGEDSLLFNCQFMGNWTCGPAAPWHGFVNLF